MKRKLENSVSFLSNDRGWLDADRSCLKNTRVGRMAVRFNKIHFLSLSGYRSLKCSGHVAGFVSINRSMRNIVKLRDKILSTRFFLFFFFFFFSILLIPTTVSFVIITV